MVALTLSLKKKWHITKAKDIISIKIRNSDDLKKKKNDYKTCPTHVKIRKGDKLLIKIKPQRTKQVDTFANPKLVQSLSSKSTLPPRTQYNNNNNDDDEGCSIFVSTMNTLGWGMLQNQNSLKDSRSYGNE
jgi:hypothetical protein